MFHEPITAEEAIKHRYRTWAGEPRGYAYKPERCAAEVHDTGLSPLSHQCYRKRGFGPEGLYCCIHAKKIRRVIPSF